MIKARFMKCYEVAVLCRARGADKLDTHIMPWHGMELRVTDTTYTAWYDQDLANDTLVVCNFKYGLCLCVVIGRRPNNDRLENMNAKPFSQPEVMTVVNHCEYIKAQKRLEVQDPWDREDWKAQVRGQDEYCRRNHGCGISKSGELVISALNESDRMFTWVYAGPLDVKGMRNTVHTLDKLLSIAEKHPRGYQAALQKAFL